MANPFTLSTSLRFLSLSILKLVYISSFDIGAIIPKFLTFLIVKKKLSMVSFSKVTSGLTINA